MAGAALWGRPRQARAYDEQHVEPAGGRRTDCPLAFTPSAEWRCSDRGCRRRYRWARGRQGNRTSSPRPDFLDVQMPELDGFDVLGALPADPPLPLIIFVTGFHEYAMKAFEANGVANLLKPVETGRLRGMVERAG